MAEQIGSLYPVVIPSYSDNADIQAAIKVYHYGSESYDLSNTDPVNLPAASVAKHFANLQNAINNINPFTTVSLANGENLNTKTENGYYSQDSDADARSANSVNYPVFPENGGVAYSGLLSVTNAENIVYQSYQMFNVSGRTILFIRTRSQTGTWSQWYRISDSTHDHDDRYYTENEVNVLLSGKQDNISGAASTITSSNLNSSIVPVTNADGKIISSSITASQLGFLSGTTTNIEANKLNTSFSNALTTSAARSAGRAAVGIFIGDPANFTPSNPQVGDLWFW
jgi:hypothetical protein